MLLPSAPRDLDTNRSQTVKEMHAEGPRVLNDTAEQRCYPFTMGCDAGKK